MSVHERIKVHLEPERLEYLGRVRRDIILARRRRHRGTQPWPLRAAAYALVPGLLAIVLLRWIPEPAKPPFVPEQIRVSLIPPEKPPETAVTKRVDLAEPVRDPAAKAVPVQAEPTPPAAVAAAVPFRPAQPERPGPEVAGVGGKPVPGSPRVASESALALRGSVRKPARPVPPAPLAAIGPAARAGRERPEDEGFAFFGQPVELGDGGVIFVLDRSGSMALASPPFADARGEVRRGSKLACVRVEVEKALERLPAERTFNLVLFGDGVYVWRPEPVPATPAAKASALEFLSTVKPMGSTRTGPALLTALEGAGRHRIILLSDGHPTADGLTVSSQEAMDRHLELVRSANRRRVAIDAFGFGVDPAGRTFLARMASENGGVFVEISPRAY